MSEIFEHLRFAKWEWLLLFIPCILLLLLRRGRGAEAAIAFSSLSVLVSLGSKVRRTAFSIGLPLMLLSLVPAILAMARPVWRTELQAKTASGIDIVVALDVSLSMSIDDFFTPEGRPLRRMDAAKSVVHDFIVGRPDDRIGLVIYSGQPYISGPITLDHDWLLGKLDEVELEILKEQGTAIGSAIAASADKLNARDAKSKIIVLITDGASNSGKLSPVEAAELSKELGIKIYTVAIGTKDGRVSRGIQRFPRQEFDLPTLKKIAELTGAEHYWAQNVAELQGTFKTIDRLEKSKAKSLTTTEDRELFAWFAGLAAAFALFGAVLLALNPPPRHDDRPTRMAPAAAVAPVIATGAALTARLRKKQWGAFVSNRLRPRLLKRSSPIPRWVAFVCMLLAAALLIIALARPQSRRETATETILGRNILFAIDLSRSMKVADLKPDRLTQAKAAAYELLDALPNDRIGVIGFAGSAYLFAPLTPDHAAIRETITQLDIDWIPNGGTNLNEGLKLSIETLKKTGTRQNALVLMSDGEEHEGKIADIAQEARTAGIEVITIGFGTEQGDFVPDDQFPDGRFRDRNGKEVISSLEPAPLQRVSEVTGGRFAIASSGADIPAMVQAAVSDLDKVRIAGREKVVTVEYYQWFVLPAILLLIGAAVAATRWRGIGATVVLLCLLPRPLEAGEVDDARAALAAGRYEEARDQFGRLADNESDPEKAYRYRLAQGNAAYEMNDLSTARSAFSEALRGSDSEFRNAAHHGVGNTLFEIGWERLSGGAPYPETGDPAEPEDKNDAFDRLSDALLDRSDDKRPPEGDMAAFEEMVKNRLEEWMKEENPEDRTSSGSELFDQLLTDWIDAVRHYDSTVAFEPADHNRELTVLHLKKLQEILKKVEENAQGIQAVPMPDQGQEPDGDSPGEEGDEPGDGEGGDEEGDGSGGDEGEDPKDGDNGDGDKKAADGEKDGDKNKGPKPGESPEEAAKRILNENADLQKGALSPGRVRFRRPEKDW